MPEQPDGTVSFLFTDIEGSTRLLAQLGRERYLDALALHRRLLRKAFTRHDGYEVDYEGDAFFVAFREAREAVAAAAEAQAALARAAWPDGLVLDVRMGIHTGEALLDPPKYVGLDVHRAARIMAAAHGGQVLVSQTTGEQVDGGSTDGLVLRELGLHHLRDFPEPEPILQLVVPGLPSEFPPIRTATELPAAAGLPDYSLPPAQLPCPFKGLAVFEPEDSKFFFGRDDLVATLVDRLREATLLAVIGPSGSGKSSLVRAGVVPEIERAARPVILFSPGEHPLEELTTRRAAAIGTGSQSPPLVVVDQFEETFTLCSDEDERRAFLEVLVTLATVDRAASVILVLRADFYGHCAAYPSLAAVLQSHHVLVGPMSSEEMRQAIERPAREVGLLLEPGLAETILKDLAGEPGALPFLSHCLLETWKRRSDRLLTIVGYLQAGGAHGAIAKTAETVFDDTLTPAEQVLARHVFLRLVEPGQRTEDVRRRASFDELVHREEDAPRVERVLGVLVDARLLIAEEGAVVIAHEALIREWPRLKTWLDDDREGRLLHRRVAEAAQEWRALGEDDSVLYRGGRLASAIEWAEGNDEALNDVERDFLAASRRAAVGELEQARRRNRRLRALAGALALLLVGAALLALFSVRERNRAELQRRIAGSRSLAGEATRKLEVRLDQALLLAFEAFRLEPTHEARTSLLGAIQRTRWMSAVLSGQQGEVTSVAFSSRGDRIAAGGSAGTVVLWHVARRRPIWTVRVGAGASIDELAFSPNGKHLAVGTGQGVLALIDVDRGSLVRTLEVYSGPVAEISVDSSGRRVRSASSFDGDVTTWDVRRNRITSRLPRFGTRAASPLAFSSDLRTIAFVGADGVVSILDGRSRDVRARIGRASLTINSLAVSGDGRTVAVGDSTGSVLLWRRSSARRLRSPPPADSEIVALALDADGEHLLYGTRRGEIGLWDVRAGRLIGPVRPGHAASITDLAFSGGDSLASSGIDGAIVLWRLQPAGPLQRTITTEGVNAMAIDPGGRTVALASFEGDGVSLRRLPAGEAVKRIPGRATAVAFHPDGRLLAVAATGIRNSVVTLWNRGARGGRLGTLPSFTNQFEDLVFSSDGRTLLAGASDGTLSAWDVETRRPLAQAVSAHDGRVFSVEAGPDALLASAGEDRLVRFWSSPPLRPVGAALRGHEEAVGHVSFSPDTKTVATPGADGTVRLWSLKTRRPDGEPLEPEIGGVGATAFSPDGKTLAALGELGVVLWDVDLRQPLGRPLALEPASFLFVEFALGGRYLVVGTDHRVVAFSDVLWSSDSERLRRRVCALVNRSLTPGEWSEFVPGEPYRETC